MFGISKKSLINYPRIPSVNHLLKEWGEKLLCDGDMEMRMPPLPITDREKRETSLPLSSTLSLCPSKCLEYRRIQNKIRRFRAISRPLQSGDAFLHNSVLLTFLTQLYLAYPSSGHPLLATLLITQIRTFPLMLMAALPIKFFKRTSPINMMASQGN